LFTKGEDSPSKQADKFKMSKALSSGKFEDQNIFKDPELIQMDKNDLKLQKRQERQDNRFEQLGIKNESKMLFYLLKWVFNAIKIDALPHEIEEEGPISLPYIKKIDLVKQLQKNSSLVKTLKYENMK